MPPIDDIAGAVSQVQVTSEVIVAAIGAAGIVFAAYLGRNRASGAPRVSAEAAPSLVETGNKMMGAAMLLERTADRLDNMAERVAVTEHSLEDTARELHAIKHSVRNIQMQVAKLGEMMIGSDKKTDEWRKRQDDQ